MLIRSLCRGYKNAVITAGTQWFTRSQGQKLSCVVVMEAFSHNGLPEDSDDARATLQNMTMRWHAVIGALIARRILQQLQG